MSSQAAISVTRMFILAMLSGMFVGAGATASLMVSRGMPSADPGMVKLVYGALFPVGLVLVIIAGAELITGNFAMFVSQQHWRSHFPEIYLLTDQSPFSIAVSG
jgi:formate/nitrite transporter FocA (FNT family)